MGLELIMWRETSLSPTYYVLWSFDAPFSSCAVVVDCSVVVQFAGMCVGGCLRVSSAALTPMLVTDVRTFSQSSCPVP